MKKICKPLILHISFLPGLFIISLLCLTLYLQQDYTVNVSYLMSTLGTVQNIVFAKFLLGVKREKEVRKEEGEKPRNSENLLSENVL